MTNLHYRKLTERQSYGKKNWNCCPCLLLSWSTDPQTLASAKRKKQWEPTKTKNIINSAAEVHEEKVKLQLEVVSLHRRKSCWKGNVAVSGNNLFGLRSAFCEVAPNYLKLARIELWLPASAISSWRSSQLSQEGMIQPWRALSCDNPWWPEGRAIGVPTKELLDFKFTFFD